MTLLDVESGEDSWQVLHSSESSDISPGLLVLSSCKINVPAMKDELPISEISETLVRFDRNTTGMDRIVKRW